MKIGYLGPAGTFSWKAAEIFCRIAQVDLELTPFKNFEEGRDMLANGGVDNVVFPIETSSAWLTDVLDLIKKLPNIFVSMGIELLTEFHLLAQRGAIKGEIKTLYSKAEALSQCSKYTRQMGGVQCMAVSSTADAAKLAEKAGIEVAAIGPLWLTDENFSPSLVSLENIKNGRTRFLVVGNGNGCVKQLKNPDQASVFATLVHRPRSLEEVLRVVGDSNTNIARMSSWPTEDHPEYNFYLELEWKRKSRQDWIKVIGLLSSLSAEEGGPLLKLKNLGLYPVYRA